VREIIATAARVTFCAVLLGLRQDATWSPMTWTPWRLAARAVRVEPRRAAARGESVAFTG
jgi:hypothetical protein